MKKHFEEMDKLRGIAICMVLLYHSIIVYPVDLHEIAWCRELHSLLWKIEMPLFFLVSGFCLSQRCADSVKDYGIHLGKKIERVLVPHLVFGLLDIVPRSIPNPLVNRQENAGEAFLDFFLYGGSDWFLWVLFLVFVVSPLAVYCYEKGIFGKLLVVVLSLLAYLLCGSVTDLFLLSMVAEFQLYFVAGYILRRELYDRDHQAWLERKSVEALGWVLFVGFAVGGLAVEGSLFMLLFVAGGSVVFLQVAKKSEGSVGKFLTICGQYSLSMYLLGGYALVVSRTFLVKVLGVTNPVIIVGGNFLLDVAITLCIAHFLIRPIRLFRFVTGGGWKNERDGNR